MRSNVFAIEDSLRQVIEEFRSQGSGPYALRNNVWTGMYIYDFNSSKFEDVIWSWSQNL